METSWILAISASALNEHLCQYDSLIRWCFNYVHLWTIDKVMVESRHYNMFIPPQERLDCSLPLEAMKSQHQQLANMRCKISGKIQYNAFLICISAACDASGNSVVRWYKTAEQRRLCLQSMRAAWIYEKSIGHTQRVVRWFLFSPWNNQLLSVIRSVIIN